MTQSLVWNQDPDHWQQLHQEQSAPVMSSKPGSFEVFWGHLSWVHELRRPSYEQKCPELHIQNPLPWYPGSWIGHRKSVNLALYQLKGLWQLRLPQQFTCWDIERHVGSPEYCQTWQAFTKSFKPNTSLNHKSPERLKYQCAHQYSGVCVWTELGQLRWLKCWVAKQRAKRLQT